VIHITVIFFFGGVAMLIVGVLLVHWSRNVTGSSERSRARTKPAFASVRAVEPRVLSLDDFDGPAPRPAVITASRPGAAKARESPETRGPRPRSRSPSPGQRSTQSPGHLGPRSQQSSEHPGPRSPPSHISPGQCSLQSLGHLGPRSPQQTSGHPSPRSPPSLSLPLSTHLGHFGPPSPASIQQPGSCNPQSPGSPGHHRPDPRNPPNPCGTPSSRIMLSDLGVNFEGDPLDASSVKREEMRRPPSPCGTQSSRGSRVMLSDLHVNFEGDPVDASSVKSEEMLECWAFDTLLCSSPSRHLEAFTAMGDHFRGPSCLPPVPRGAPRGVARSSSKDEGLNP